MNIIITAPKHLGKSTAVRRLVSLLPGKVSGFITEFIDRDKEDRVLILRSVDSSRSVNAVTWQRGGYKIDYSAFDRFAPSLIDPDSDYIVIDELGKFEKNCEALRSAVEKAFDGESHVIASVRLDAAGWMQELKSRPDTLVIDLNEENRDSLPREIMHKLGLG